MRLVMPWVCIAVGVVMLVIGVVKVRTVGDLLFVFMGAGLLALGLITFFINRWQERRGF